MNDKIIVGLDIGSTKICAVVGRINENDYLEILGVGKAPSVGVEKGVIVNIDQTVEAIRHAIGEAEKQSDIDIRVVNVGIAGKHIQTQKEYGSITRTFSDQAISVEDINRLSTDMYKTLTPVGTEIIHVIPQEYTIDFSSNIKEPVGRLGVKLGGEFNIITAHTNAIAHLRKCLLHADLTLDSLVLESIASGMSVLNKEEKEAGVALIDIGGDTTEIAIFHENMIRYTSAVPFGGNSITNDIKRGCSIMANQAELLKIKHGKALVEQASLYDVVVIPGIRGSNTKEISVHNLSQIIEARMEEIVDMVYVEIMKSGLEKHLSAGLVLTGGGANLQCIKDLFELNTGISTRVGNPSEYLNLSNQYLSHIKNPEYSTAIGLVLAGFKALDERENRYLKIKNQSTNLNNKNISKPSFQNPDRSETKGGFFKDIFTKARNLLIDDDMDNQGEYK